MHSFRFLPRLSLIVVSILLFTWSGSAELTPLPADPEILNLVEQVNEDSLMATIDRLVAFHTRHTYSDTLSDTQGIGAAQRWLHSEFARHGMTPGYHEWWSTVDEEPYRHLNVTGEFSGSGTDETLVMLGAHLDSRTTDRQDNTSFAPGANDNGSGIAAMLEIARIIQNYETPLPIRMAGFTGEEQGLLGSYVMAGDYWAQDVSISAMLNMDMITNVVDDDGNMDSSFYSIYFPPGCGYLPLYIKWIGAAYTEGIDEIRDMGPSWGSDHYSFGSFGYNAAMFHEPMRRSSSYHTPEDLPEYMSPWYFKHVTGLVLGLALTIAKAPAPLSEPPVAANVGDGQGVVVYWDESSFPENGTLGVYLRSVNRDSLYIVESGTSLVAEGFDPGVSVGVAITRIDQDGRPSPFSPATYIRLTDIPSPPSEFTIACEVDGAHLSWQRQYEQYLTGYRVERSMQSETFEVVAQLLTDEAEWLDNTIEPGTVYNYRVRSVWEGDITSEPSEVQLGSKATFDQGILLLDGTNESPISFPNMTDDEVDLRYRQMLQEYHIGFEYDIQDSLRNERHITEADLVPYNPIVLHLDYLIDQTDPALEASLLKYMARGGKLMFSGWNLAQSLIRFQDQGRPFLHEAFGIDSVLLHNEQLEQNFDYAMGFAGYNDLHQDTAGILDPHEYLIRTNTLYTDPDSTDIEVIARFIALDENSEQQMHAVGLQQRTDLPQWVLIDVPLGLSDQEDAARFMHQAMEQLQAPLSAVTDQSGSSSLPTEFQITRVWPNPFNASVQVEIHLPNAMRTNLSIHDILGRRVTKLEDGVLPAGRTVRFWDARGHASGTYFVRLESRYGTDVKRITLIK